MLAEKKKLKGTIGLVSLAKIAMQAGVRYIPTVKRQKTCQTPNLCMQSVWPEVRKHQVNSEARQSDWKDNLCSYFALRFMLAWAVLSDDQSVEK